MVNILNKKILYISAAMWACVGIMLLNKGLRLTIGSTQEVHTPLLSWIQSVFERPAEQSALFIVCLGIFFGFLKGRFALRRSINRIIDNVKIAQKVSFKIVYPPKFLFLMAAMMGLAMTLKALAVPKDIMGLIDIAVGSALINSSIIYLRNIITLNLPSKS